MLPGCAFVVVYGVLAAARYLRPPCPFQLIEKGNAQELERRLTRGLDPDRPVPVKPNKKEGRPANSISMVYYAVMTNQRACLDLLLLHHANPNLVARNQHTTPLLAAVRLKRDGFVAALLAAGADPNLQDIHGYTPLIEAAATGREADCRRLLDAGARTDSTTFNAGVCALVAAARHNHNDVIALLLAHGADPNLATFDGSTALMEAAYKDNAAGCRLLLEAGADPEAEIAGGNLIHATALLQCALHNTLGPAGELLAAGANVNAKWKKNGATALHICITNGYAVLAEQLLDHGADPEALNGTGNTSLHLALYKDWGYPESVLLKLLKALLKHGAEPEQRDELGRTALLHCLWDTPADVAVQRERVRLLLKYGANALACVDDPRGKAPPISALIMAATWGDVETATLLLDAGADAGYFPPIDGGFARSALDMAVQEHHPQMVRLLLARGARFNPVGANTCPALLHCIDEDLPELARMLLEAGVSPSGVAHSGDQGELQFPAIGLAALRDRPGLMALLREFGASLDERTNWGATPLHLAVHNDAVASAAWLLEQGHALEATDDEGLRPLHEAAKTGSANAVELLLKHGADPNSRATFGRQPLDLLGYNHENIEPKTFKRIEQALTKAGAKLSASYT